MEFTPLAILGKFLIEPFIRYGKRPKIHLDVQIESSITGNLKTVARFSLDANNKFSIGLSGTNESGKVYVTLKNLSNQAVLIDEIGARVLRLRRNQFSTKQPLLMHFVKFSKIVETYVARKMMLRLATNGTIVGNLQAKGPFRLEGYDFIRKPVGTIDSLELIATGMKVQSPGLVPYCIAGNQSHSIIYGSIVIVSDRSLK